MTPSGIEPATFRFVAQHLNHCATAYAREKKFGNHCGRGKSWCVVGLGMNSYIDLDWGGLHYGGSLVYEKNVAYLDSENHLRSLF